MYMRQVSHCQPHGTLYVGRSDSVPAVPQETFLKQSGSLMIFSKTARQSAGLRGAKPLFRSKQPVFGSGLGSVSAGRDGRSGMMLDPD